MADIIHVRGPRGSAEGAEGEGRAAERGAELRGPVEERRGLSPQAAAGAGKGPGPRGRERGRWRARSASPQRGPGDGQAGSTPRLASPCRPRLFTYPHPARGCSARASPPPSGRNRGDGAGPSNSNGGGRRAAVTSAPRTRGARREGACAGGGAERGLRGFRSFSRSSPPSPPLTAAM